MEKYKLIFAVLILFVFSACSEDDLIVENLNEPDTERVLSNVEDFPGVIDGGYISFWQMQTRAEPNLVLATVSDVLSCSWNNFGMNVYSSEPRVVYNNSPTSPFAGVGERAWNLGYGGVGAVNDVMRLLKERDSAIIDGVDQKPMLLANGLFIQGTTFGHLAALYDRVYVVDETIPVSDLTSIPFPAEPNYMVAVDSAVSKLQQCIAICEANDFVLWPTFMRGVGYDQDQLAKLAHTYIARFKAYAARNAAENTAADWAAVVDHASKGIDFDFVIVGDGSFWYDEFKAYGSFPGWVRVDQKTISLMDPSQPSRYPVDGTTDLGPATTDDARLASDFTYVPTQNYNPGRGLYHYSNYRVSRYDDTHGFAGNMYLILQAENDLLQAEGLLMSGGSATDAAALINNTRVGRGALTALTGTESRDDLMAALKYERTIELILTSSLVSFADARRYETMQEGTFTQFPVPGSDLELLGQALYTYPGGLSVSN
ncbi:MAG: RagB/SusD family nutrient uptake outer membrane protein [Cyclobacteriaceae bacterium]